MSPALADKTAALLELLRSFGRVAVAYSGGVDSAVVAAAAFRACGDRAVAVTAVSPSLASGELELAEQVAQQIGIRHRIVRTAEFEDENYVRNPYNRCYFCKTELYGLCDRERQARGLAVVLDGFNADDLQDHRPGQKAAREHQVRSPLAEAGLTKDEVRAWSLALGLPTWDKPAVPCLASRIPYGTPVSVAVLGRVERAERALRAMGFDALRVRHYDDTARIEVPADRFAEVVRRAAEVVDAVGSCGYRYVTLDLAGLRSGNLNQALG